MDKDPRWRRVVRAGVGVLVALLLLAVLAGPWGYVKLRASLPQLDGELPLTGLRAPVTVERDAAGVPTIRGANRVDLARATGFLHAQDRFFQMDLLRRRAAGELAELIGAAVLPVDREVRLHRFRDLARRVIERAEPGERALVEAYTAGANAGLDALGAKPFEYFVLRAEPDPWRPEDTVLCLLAMFLTLHDESGVRESTVGLIHDTLPQEMYEFLVPRGTEWDAPLVGEAYETPPIPGPEVFDLRSTHSAGTPKAASRLEWAEAPVLGSNNWAVAGTHTADGRALLANDMHLGISVPNTWYRASLVWPSEDASADQRITGVTLPGTPAIVVGSNGHIAWGFTNSQADWNDVVILELDPDDPEVYLTPEGPRKLEHHDEPIRVKGQDTQTLDVVWTVWGPVIGHDHEGRPRAVRWTAHEEEAVNLGLGRFERARDVDQAIQIASLTGIPPQNFVCADSTGRIGWTIIGRIPRRVGFEGRLPGSWANASRRWDGWLRTDEYPRVVDPPLGRVWTANARVVGGEMLTKLGEGSYAFGARARQIRDDLLALQAATVSDLSAIQLDDRAVFLERWQRLLLDVLSPEAIASSPERAELRRFVESWGARAATSSVGYRMVRAFRLTVADRVFEPLTAACRERDEDFRYLRIWQYEGPLWRLVEELTEGGTPLGDLTWGERNTVRIQHPLSRALPWLGRFLDMPREPLPGGSHMPRVQGPTHGASERLVVSPGHEDEGVFHMPGGQSGHPLSPFHAEGHAAWAKGEPAPFLPGPTIHTLVLTSR
jgi:penicillin amidase